MLVWNKCKLRRSLGHYAAVQPVRTHDVCSCAEPSASKWLRVTLIQMCCFIVWWLRWMVNTGTVCCHTQSRLPPHTLYLLLSLNLHLPVVLAFLGLDHHRFHSPTWNSQKHKEISWLFKEERLIKNACRSFLSLKSHQWLQVDNTISHHGNELVWAHSLWMLVGFFFRLAIVSFLNRWKARHGCR